TSGSMAGAKIQQARNALKFLVGKLNDGDRFNIVQFSSFAETWQKGLVSARERREDALKYADTLLAQGGTDIAGALDAAVSSLGNDPARPSYIVFMTDGKPTMGETTDARRILAKVTAAKGRANGEAIRLFTWGVGYDVDTHLLDDMANEGGGVSEYVRPEEDIASKVAAFANKASQPVLTGLDLKVLGNKVQLANLLPRALPDLYAGGQIVLLGRYTGDGDVAFELSGNVNGKVEKFIYENKFAAAEAKGGFIELLWAQRRIGHLLDQIRLHGETKELVDDVIRLSKEYGIQTPYTSNLILEDGMQVPTTTGMPSTPRFRGLAGGRGEAEKRLDVLRQNAPEAPKPEATAPTPAAKAAADVEESLVLRFKDKDGKAGVDVARRLREMKESEQAGAPSVAAFRKAAGTRFVQYRGLWVDERFPADAVVVTVKFGSEAYFRLIEKQPSLVEAFKLGTDVVVVTATGKALAVSSVGEEKLTDAQIDALFSK
ncbi:MAG TPA: VWA domain-containing protein, partial [Planctomycetota bacterium]|nr:VWA domain-containing protein [Planctomycetota bacterium]